MEGLREALISFLLVYGPAMVANGSPVAVLKKRSGHPIDFGRRWWDGRRILGDGKTFEGLLVGIAAAVVAGSVLATVFGLLGLGIDAAVILVTALVSGVGAMLGDIVKSFFKRRLGYERGANLPVADQLDFYIGATIMVHACPSCVKPALEVTALGALLVYVLHRTTNRFAHRKGWKDRPW